MRGQKEQIIPLLSAYISKYLADSTYLGKITDLRRYSRLNNRANMPCYDLLCMA